MSTAEQPSPIEEMKVTSTEAISFSAPRPWSHGLFSCFGDCSTCCVSMLCPCVVYGQNKTRLKSLNQTGSPHPNGGEACASDCFLHAVLTSLGCFGWVLETRARAATRKRYTIEGGALGDCCAATWCHPCTLTQESRELHEEERKFPGHGTPT